MTKHIHIHVGGKTKDADEAASKALQLINQAGEVLFQQNRRDLKSADPRDKDKIAKREAVLKKLLEARDAAKGI